MKTLSKNMQIALKVSLNNADQVICKNATKNALISRNLCDNNGILTSEGKVVLISILPLKKQAEILGINIYNMPDGFNGFPKIHVKNYLSKFYDYTNTEHYKILVSSEILRNKIFPEIYVGNRLLKLEEYSLACFDEGSSILTLLSCMCYEVICEAWQRSEHNLESIAYSLGSISLLSLMENKKGFFENLSQKIVAAVAKSQLGDIEKSYDKLNEQSDMLEDEHISALNCIGINKNFITSLYNSLGKDCLMEIIKIYLRDPSSFGKGWPDITAITNSNTAKLIEVKTTDKLHYSQIVTFSEIKKIVNIEICRVIKASA